jgi:hypothetical protein
MGLDLSHIKPIKIIDEDKFYDYFTIEELSNFPYYIAKHLDFIVDKDFEEYEIEKVIYFEEIGYQRKSVNKNFHSDFVDGIYLDLETVKKAFNYLEPKYKFELEDLQSNFQTNFIDNFEEGESIFWVSW